MNLGTILISISLLFTLGAILLFIKFFLNRDEKLRNFAKLLIFGSMVFTTFAFLLLLYYFLTSNFNIHYIWLLSSKNLEWQYKLSAIWAGEEGSLLLWTWLIVFAIVIEIFLQNRREKKIEEKKVKNKSKRKKVIKTAYFDWSIVISLTIIAVFLVILLIKSPFAEIHNIDLHFKDENNKTITKSVNPLDYYPNGNGLNPTLRNVWMVIHPPLLFIGYALITIPFSASMSYLITDDKNWTKISILWSRIAWLFLTLGIGVGAVWAYIELSYGGYWAWDPVEVGSLIPWTSLTAFLHAQQMNLKKERYRNLIPILGMFTFLAMIFATFVTRSGIWKSVHSYQDKELVDIILGLNIISLIFISMIICILIFGTILVIKKFLMEEEKEEKFTWGSSTMLITIILLILLATIMFIGIIASRGEANPTFYETRLIPFSMILFTILFVCTIWKIFGKKKTKFAVILIVFLSIISVFILPKLFPGKSESFYGKISSHHIVAFFIPIFIFSISSIIYKTIKALKMKSKRERLKTISLQIIHFGIVLITLSYCVSQKMSEEKILNLNMGKSENFKGFEIKFKEIKISRSDIEIIYDFIIEIYKNDKLVDIVSPRWIYYLDISQWHTEVGVKHFIKEDLYIYVPFPIKYIGISSLTQIIENVNNEGIEVNVKTIPFMNFLWGGMIIIACGIIFRVIIDYKKNI